MQLTSHNYGWLSSLLAPPLRVQSLKIKKSQQGQSDMDASERLIDNEVHHCSVWLIKEIILIKTRHQAVDRCLPDLNVSL